MLLHRLSLSSQIIVYHSIFIYLFSVNSCTAPWTLRKTVHTRVITFAPYREMEIIVMSVSVVLPVYLRSYFRNHKSEFIASFLRMLLVTVVRSSFGNRPIHCESKKTRRYAPIRLRQMLTDSQNSFTVRLSRKFITKSCLNTPPHRKRVATVPCEISMFKKSHCSWSRPKWSKLSCMT